MSSQKNNSTAKELVRHSEIDVEVAISRGNVSRWAFALDQNAATMKPPINKHAQPYFLLPQYRRPRAIVDGR
jgi:hypothetical protein